jgi:BRCT domain type II-containing protein
MIHRIDGEIMAVGVLDFTPNVLSSVYLFYNPKFEFLSPGTFAAVREIEYQLKNIGVFQPRIQVLLYGSIFPRLLKKCLQRHIQAFTGTVPSYLELRVPYR